MSCERPAIMLFGMAAVIGTIMMMLVTNIDTNVTIANTSVWYDSYEDVVSGVQLGFSLYNIVALMGIFGFVLPMLFALFSTRGGD